MTFFRADEAYMENLRHRGRQDGFKALFLFGLYISLVFLLGYLYTTSLPGAFLTAAGRFLDIVALGLAVAFLWLGHEKLKTIGINSNNPGKSLALGAIGGIALVAAVTVAEAIGSGRPRVEAASLVVTVTFVIGAVSEEMVFRGYIQTRLVGLIKNSYLASALNAILFLSIHYPVKWVVSGEFSLWALPLTYVICLVLLHFLCDFVYRKTNCLWGSILLHAVYNIGGAVVVVG
ncbi:MAG: type II CAAX endopeptidase family protein [Bacillota bacterium]|nr:type II CAAX endopeptidase family protein [Bacillota bacterium]